MIDVTEKPGFWSFGYLPTGKPKKDRRGRRFGHRNIMKRLQSRDIFNALDLKDHEVVLDFGCGTGFLTVEMAKLCKKAYGIDVNPALERQQIPPRLRERLEYYVGDGRQTPFDAQTFDCVLASEVLPMVPEPEKFLAEIRRVIKPDGRLVVVNGVGHPAIERAYENDGFLLRVGRWLGGRKVPASYADYCKALQHSFGTAMESFPTTDSLCEMLASAGFETQWVRYTPSNMVHAFLSWRQFFSFVLFGRSVNHDRFVPQFVVLSFLDRFFHRRKSGGAIIGAKLAAS